MDDQFGALSIGEGIGAEGFVFPANAIVGDVCSRLGDLQVTLRIKRETVVTVTDDDAAGVYAFGEEQLERADISVIAPTVD